MAAHAERNPRNYSAISSQPSLQSSTKVVLWVRVRVTLRIAVCRQSSRLGVKPLETHDHRIFSSLMRGCVCCLQLLLAFASAVILGCESRWTHDHKLLSQIRDFPNLEGQVPVFISPTNRVAQLYPGTGFPFRRLLLLAGLQWRLSNPPPHGR
jgi:hypothetical protein